MLNCDHDHTAYVYVCEWVDAIVARMSSVCNNSFSFIDKLHMLNDNTRIIECVDDGWKEGNGETTVWILLFSFFSLFFIDSPEKREKERKEKKQKQHRWNPAMDTQSQRQQ